MNLKLCDFTETDKFSLIWNCDFSYIVLFNRENSFELTEYQKGWAIFIVFIVYYILFSQSNGDQ